MGLAEMSHAVGTVLRDRAASIRGQAVACERVFGPDAILTRELRKTVWVLDGVADLVAHAVEANGTSPDGKER